MAGNLYRVPAPSHPDNSQPGVGEPPGRPGHPYVASAGGSTKPAPATAPNPRLPEAKPGTVPKGGAKSPKGAPPQPSK